MRAYPHNCFRIGKISSQGLQEFWDNEGWGRWLYLFLRRLADRTSWSCIVPSTMECEARLVQALNLRGVGRLGGNAGGLMSRILQSINNFVHPDLSQTRISNCSALWWDVSLFSAFPCAGIKGCREILPVLESPQCEMHFQAGQAGAWRGSSRL